MTPQKIDVGALLRLKACRSNLTNQQYKTLRGQVLAGNHVGAMKGLKNLLDRARRQK